MGFILYIDKQTYFMSQFSVRGDNTYNNDEIPINSEKKNAYKFFDVQT